VSSGHQSPPTPDDYLVSHTEEVVEYKRFVYSLAETAAGAHREGGLLRRGEPVSEAEQATIDEIAAIFDEQPGA